MNAEEFHAEMVSAADELADAVVAAQETYSKRVDAANDAAESVPLALRVASIMSTSAEAEKRMGVE